MYIREINKVLKGRYTMSTPNDSLSIGGTSYIDSLNNEYLKAALMSRNANFRGSGTYSVSDSDSVQTREIPVNYATASPDTSNTGLWVTGAVGAAALITFMAKGKGGNPIDGAKKIWNSLFNSTKKSAESVSSKLETLRIIKKGDKKECFIPGERATYKGTAAKDYMNSYGIDPRSLTSFKNGTSKLTSGTFKTESGYTVTFEGDKIIKLVNKRGADVTKTATKDVREKIKEEIETVKEMQKGWMKGFTEAKVRREVGDNIVQVIYKPKQSPVITELNALKPLKLEDDAVKAWYYAHPEEKLAKDALKKFKAPEGMKVGEAKIPVKGVIYHFENGEIKGITKDGKFIPKGKKECDALLADKEEEMKKVYDMIFNSDSLSDAIRRKLGKYLKGIDTKFVEATYVKA